MNTKSLTTIAVALGSSFGRLAAGQRSSADYFIPAETLDAGGRRAVSASYTNEGSTGGIAGISASAGDTLKAGYPGQLYEPAGLTLTGPGTNVNEAAIVQFAAWLLLDDATLLAIPAASVAWSVPAGPLSGITSSGLATTGAVYQNTGATLQGLYLGFTGTLGITIVNTLPDNFGTYAGDGIADDWQVLYFGLNNPSAGAAVDSDGDGETNLFEFNAGLVPNDPQSHFHLRLETAPGPPAQRRIVFSPVVPGRNYTVEVSLSTAGPWAPLAGAVPGDNGNERTVTDANAAGLRRFYRVIVEKP